MSDPTVIYHETFENGLADADSQTLRSYVGSDGTTFTGSGYWTEPAMCNGILISRSAPDALGCAATANAEQLRRMANILGQVDGGTLAGSDGNHAVSAYTNSPSRAFPLAANDVEFATESPIALSGGTRSLTFSVDAASLNCATGAARLSFFLADGADELPATRTPINVCADPRASTYAVDRVNFVAGRFISNSSVLFSGSSLGIVMRNGYGSTAGNDNDNGGVANTATANGSYDGDDVGSNVADTNTPGPDRNPELTIVKNATLNDKNGNGAADQGETITYSFVVTNTGNVTVLDVSVADDRVKGLDPASVGAPRDRALFTADPYVVTARDIDNGSVDNTAVAQGHTVDGDDVESEPDTVSVDTADPVQEAGLLPDTGGSFFGTGALGAVVLLAGATVLVRRRLADADIA